MAATTLPTSGERIDYATILPGRTKAVILAGVLLSLFLAALDQTIVSTALPAIVREFNGIDLVAWVSTGYLLASTAMVPIYGKLSDLYGRRVVLLVGIVIFLVGSALCGIAGSMLQLIIYRVFQGIGAAALTSTAFAVPADLFVPAERARYMGMFGAVFGLSSVLGPFLGGTLTDQLSWHWVFYVNLPLGLIALAFIMLKMPALKSGLRAPIDWLGTILLVLAVVPLLLGLTLDKSLYGWSSPLIIGLLSTAAVATALFLLVELRAASPIIALGLFRNRTYTVSVVATLLNGSAFFGAILFISIFLVNVVGLTATAAGTAQIPLMVAFVFSSILASTLVARIGRYKPLILTGFVIMLVGFFSMLQLSADSSAMSVSWRMVLLGLGMGPAMPLLSLALQNAVPYEQVGSATASRQFFQQLGQAAGAAIFGVVLSTTLTAQLAANLAPVAAQLPPALRSQADPARFRNSGVATEGAEGQRVDVGAGIAEAVDADYARQRELLTAALAQGSAPARAELLADPQLPTALHELLQEPNTGAQALEPALATLDTAHTAAQQQARALGDQLSQAVRQSFASSITRIYSYAIWLVAAACAITAIWLPETPLRKSNRG